MERTATVLGATGLIGSKIVNILLSDDSFTKIRVISRRPLNYRSSKISVTVIDFMNYLDFRDAIKGSDVVFCAVGTTKRKVKGDMAEYRKVDFDIPVFAARFCQETGCPAFLMVSSVGANSESNNFYLKFKGEAEDAVIAAEVRSLSIFRPSMLLGKRKEFRFFEKVVQAIVRPFRFLFPKKYKPIEAQLVAASMVAVSKDLKPGFHIYHYPDMIKILNAKS